MMRRDMGLQEYVIAARLGQYDCVYPGIRQIQIRWGETDGAAWARLIVYAERYITENQEELIYEIGGGVTAAYDGPYDFTEEIRLLIYPYRVPDLCGLPNAAVTYARYEPIDGDRFVPFLPLDENDPLSGVPPHVPAPRPKPGEDPGPAWERLDIMLAAQRSFVGLAFEAIRQVRLFWWTRPESTGARFEVYVAEPLNDLETALVRLIGCQFGRHYPWLDEILVDLTVLPMPAEIPRMPKQSDCDLVYARWEPREDD